MAAAANRLGKFARTLTYAHVLVGRRAVCEVSVKQNGPYSADLAVA